jgi:trimeric autotransporter adhesin
MKTRIPFILAASVCGLILTSKFAFAQGTAFTYQGQLLSNNIPANGPVYLEFGLSTNCGGSLISPLIEPGTNICGYSGVEPVNVSNGLFTVTLDFGSSPNYFTGQSLWLEIQQSTNGISGPYDTTLALVPLTPTPYAILAENVLNLNGYYGNAVTFGNSGNSFYGNGSGLTGVNAATAATAAALTNGEAIGSAQGNTIGQGVSALSFIGGGQNNTIQSANVLSIIGGGDVNSIGNYSVESFIGGGTANSIQASSEDSTIAGGNTNIIQANAGWSFIGGGENNQTFSGWSVISGGDVNSISNNSPQSFIGGGMANSIGGNAADSTISGGGYNYVGTGAGVSTIGGGGNNTIQPSATDSTIGGGTINTIQTNAYQSTIAGGNVNMIQGGAHQATIAGGDQNVIQVNAIDSTIGGGTHNTNSSSYATVGGGFQNTLLGGATAALIGGGQGNTVATSADHAAIGGGWNNIITSGAYDSFIGGGANNTNSGGYGTLGGGYENTVGSGAATLAGGYENTASGNTSTVGGGSYCVASANYATIGGGDQNTANGQYATIPGGYNNHANGEYSFAGGHQATANNEGSFVWSDSTGSLIDGSPNQFVVSASGGFRVSASSGDLNMGGTLTGPTVANAPGNTPNHIAVELTTAVTSGPGLLLDPNSAEQYSILLLTGGGNAGYITWGGQGIDWACDRNVKENFLPVDSSRVLEQLAAMPISTWTYKAQSRNPVRYLGPVAQDFHAAFGLGPDDKHINEIDEMGVALAAIQGLNQKLDAENAKLQGQVADLQSQLDGLRKAVALLTGKSATYAVNTQPQEEK